ncbi:MAG TPA: YIP1 family protein [Anaerolineae bacterium]|nr:YIP1 family protein [Anaerolineae bacterium]
MLERIIGVFKLDTQVFAEIEADQTATTQAAMVVAIVAVLSAIGSGIGAAIGGSGFLGSVIFSLVWTFIAWVVWSAVTFFVGAKLFGGEADMGEMLRVIGFSQAPLMLQIIPCIGGIVGAIWALAAGVVAVREGLDFDMGKAIATVAIGWVIVFVLNMILLSVLGIGAVGIGALSGAFSG